MSNSTVATPVLTVVVDINSKAPPPASPKDNCPVAVVPEPDTEATFKTLSAVTFPVGNFKV